MGKRVVIEVSGEREEEIVYEAVTAAVEAYRRNPLNTQFALNQEAFPGKKADNSLKIPAFLTGTCVSQQEKGMREILYRKKGGGADGRTDNPDVMGDSEISGAVPQR